MEQQLNELDEIWRDDLLKRREEASRIHRYLIERYKAKPSERGFVLAVDADWGVGKSFMLERWHREANLQKHPTVFFDAWKNDFTETPLLAFIAELHEGLEQYLTRLSMVDKARRTAVKTLKRLWKPALTILGSAVAKHIAGLSLSQVNAVIHDEFDSKALLAEEMDHLKTDSKEVRAELNKAIEKALGEHKTVRNAIGTFKETMECLIAALSEADDVELPLLIFIDELDRCRPNYSIELMEGIKHLFGVPGVYFIVSTNIQQLSESVKAVYGSGFDSKRYLKRFFDLHCSLPEPNKADFARFIVDKMAFGTTKYLEFGQLDRYDSSDANFGHNPSPQKIVGYVFERHASAFDLSLRDQEQIGTLLEAAILGLPHSTVHVFLLVFLAVVYHLDPTILRNIERAGNLDAVTGLPAIYTDSTKGLISFTSYDGSGKRRSNNFTVREIASFYLTRMRSSSAHPDEYSDDFPGTLTRTCDWKKRGSSYVADYADYFDIIRSAASFRPGLSG